MMYVVLLWISLVAFALSSRTVSFLKRITLHGSLRSTRIINMQVPKWWFVYFYVVATVVVLFRVALSPESVAHRSLLWVLYFTHVFRRLVEEIRNVRIRPKSPDDSEMHSLAFIFGILYYALLVPLTLNSSDENGRKPSITSLAIFALAESLQCWSHLVLHKEKRDRQFKERKPKSSLPSPFNCCQILSNLSPRLLYLLLNQFSHYLAEMIFYLSLCVVAPVTEMFAMALYVFVSLCVNILNNTEHERNE